MTKYTHDNLGRLEKVDLREAWLGEATDFTPWLARDENIVLLAEAIGIELEVEAEEKDVGPFRADVLCRNTADDSYVLIENQLERTDHSHLGQIITYAAGLDAVTVVWIAARFTEEHRAALDWLNDLTDNRLNVFGLEVELWRIGDSAIAPKFNVVSQPNDWTRSVRSVSPEVAERKHIKLQYWMAVREIVLQLSPELKPAKPSDGGSLAFGVLGSGCKLTAILRAKQNVFGVRLAITGENADAIYHGLQAEKDSIEKEIGAKLEWSELWGDRGYAILLTEEGDPLDSDDWPRQHTWLREKLDLFRRTFEPRVKVAFVTLGGGG